LAVKIPPEPVTQYFSTVLCIAPLHGAVEVKYFYVTLYNTVPKKHILCNNTANKFNMLGITELVLPCA
jgi:hypothetical protein